MSSEEKSSTMSQKISSPSHSNSSSSSKHDSRQVSDSWEIVEGLRGGLSNVQEPEKQAGYMLKKRKWPMKGWHKRFFYLDKGILKYAKCAADVEKGKLHGCIDVGLSVMAIKKKAKCIDLDAEENIYHLKIKSQELFDEWVSKLRHHRLYRQNEIRASPAKQSSLHSPVSFTSQAKVTAWLQSSDDMDRCTKELSVCEAQLLELNHLLRSMEVLHRTCSAPAINALCENQNHILKLFVLIYIPEMMLDSFLCLYPVHTTMKSALCMLTTEKERLKQMLEHESCPAPSAQLLGMKNALAAQDSSDGSRPLVHQVSNESRASITESLSEFFDAQEVLLSASSSENEVRMKSHLFYQSHKCAALSVNAIGAPEPCFSFSACVENGGSQEQRRSCLPSPSPNTSNISLWNILKNNIGKDLSKVAMPVQLNEPLNTLQRLCEELEYSELLDKAAHTQDPFERMVYIATFAVSGYASSYYRAGGKPFNPVLGETYECDRPDKGFGFVAEQVSHHPPISACHAESKNFIFWQDVRWRNKFWGKSMEIVPVGTTHVVLPGFGDHYEWNKVTSCIHNILSGQRWIEHYGEISIKNSNSEKCQCKVTFIKAKYWNSSMNEVEGAVTDHKGKIVHKLSGKWHEGMYCGSPPSAKCIWRTNPMPPDYEQYYSFTKFAMELNELDPLTKPLLPPTDTRLRFDQRLLEEGNVESAEEQKQRIEQLQRERRRVLEENHMTHQPRFFQKSKDDTWVSNNTYWELRKDPGFSNLDCPVLW
uniref:Oxysterol-binding protein n=1 Tax=Sinocyclocheilus anshuiensis TaxID=1608454 RepID=A0A671L1K6_9TELE